MAVPNRIYGIDLGTTYSCIAYVDEHGIPVIVANSEGQPTTPSVVYFENGANIVVGKTAKDVAELHADQVVSTVKREMGNGDWIFMFDGKTYQSQDIASFILKKLVADAQVITGDVITDVVITCPAYFGIKEKEATQQAGVLAGLKVRYLIPEPVAAALAYGISQSNDQVILVYDLGGGTFDVSIIEVKAEAITVICVGGDHQLGGKNWDEDIATWFAGQFAAETGVEAETLLNDAETWQELLTFAESAKVALSSRGSYTQKIHFDAGSAKIELTREVFDQITDHWLQRTLTLTEELLATAKDKGYGKIDKLLLVGGSTYMPQVKQAVTEKFPFEAVQFDPNQAVAKGAAQFGFKCALEEQLKIRIAGQTGQDAASLDVAAAPEAVRLQAEREVALANGMALPDMLALTQKKVTNVVSKSFGVVVFDVDNNDYRISNLIVLNQQVPCSVSKQFYTNAENQTRVVITCKENGHQDGPDEPPIEMKHALAEVGSAELIFDRPLPKGSPVEIEFSMTPDGRLVVHGKDLTTQREIRAELQTVALMNQEDLERNRIRNSAFTVS